MFDDLEWLLIGLGEMTEQELRDDASDDDLQALQRECDRLIAIARSELQARAKARAAQQSLLLD